MLNIVEFQAIENLKGKKATILSTAGGFPNAIKCTIIDCKMTDYAGERNITFITYRPIKKRKDATISIRQHTTIAIFDGHVDINDGPAEVTETDSMIISNYGACFDPANFKRAMGSTTVTPVYKQERD
jgi:hypothetical protein